MAAGMHLSCRPSSARDSIRGRAFSVGTLVGALLIAVINNGMNLLGIDPFAQKIVLGCVILLAVLLDRLRHR